MTLYWCAHVISLNIYLNTFLRYTLWSARVQNIWPDGPKMGAVKNRSCTKELKSDISCHTSQRSARCLAIRTTCVCAQPHNCTTVQLHNCTTAQPHNCTTAHPHHMCVLSREIGTLGKCSFRHWASVVQAFFINSIWSNWFTWCAIFHILNAFTRQILKSWCIFWIVLEHC